MEHKLFEKIEQLLVDREHYEALKVLQSTQQLYQGAEDIYNEAQRLNEEAHAHLHNLAKCIKRSRLAMWFCIAAGIINIISVFL